MYVGCSKKRTDDQSVQNPILYGHHQPKKAHKHNSLKTKKLSEKK